jgi:hypothetical protein
LLEGVNLGQFCIINLNETKAMKALLLTICLCSITALSFAQQADSSHSKKTTQETAPKLSFTGEMNLTTGYYETHGLAGLQGQFNPWIANGSFTLISQSGWVVPVNFLWSSQNYQYRQPYNQIGTSPQFKKWLKLHGGYRNVYFSPLTLAGHSFLGGGIELNPGILRIGAVYGKLNRAIESNYANPDQVASFERTGYSLKLGLGNQRDYFDVILLKASDNPSSIQMGNNSLKPAENLVVGISSRLHLGPKLRLEIDAAGSAYTHDLRTDKITATQVQAADKELHAQYLQHTKDVFVPRASTQAYSAVQASLVRKGKYTDLKMRYKRIEPGYKSMGAYYFQTDLESFLIAPTLKMFKNRLSFQTSIGYQHDNLLNQKKTQTDRVIGSANLALATDNNLMIDVGFSNYGITQKAGYIPLNDTLRLSQNDRTFSSNVMKIWVGNSATHNLMAAAIYQELKDLNPLTADFNQNQNWNYTFNYSWQNFSLYMNVNAGYSYTQTKALGMSTVFQGPSLTVSKKLLKNQKLSTSLGVSYLISEEHIAEFNQKGTIITNTLGIEYQLTPTHRFSLHWNYIESKGMQPFSQYQGNIQYTMSF